MRVISDLLRAWKCLNARDCPITDSLVLYSILENSRVLVSIYVVNSLAAN